MDDLREIDDWFLRQQEPVKGCLLSLRAFILGRGKAVTEVWRYKMPFYCLEGKRFCYLWVHKRSGMPYLGVVDGKKFSHPRLIREKRSRMKILLIDPRKDIPVRTVRKILDLAVGRSFKSI